MVTVRRELMVQAAAEIWEYVNENYCVDIDIPDIQSILDDNLGFAVEATCEAIG